MNSRVGTRRGPPTGPLGTYMFTHRRNNGPDTSYAAPPLKSLANEHLDKHVRTRAAAYHPHVAMRVKDFPRTATYSVHSKLAFISQYHGGNHGLITGISAGTPALQDDFIDWTITGIPQGTKTNKDKTTTGLPLLQHAQNATHHLALQHAQNATPTPPAWPPLTDPTPLLAPPNAPTGPTMNTAAQVVAVRRSMGPISAAFGDSTVTGPCMNRGVAQVP
jgi:hypothetical protein